MPTAKRNHFIPKFYLSRWADTNEKVCCLNKSERRIFQPNITKVCTDRIWNPVMEGNFSKIENAIWKQPLNKLIETENIDCLSSIEILNFLSFAIALHIRNKPTFKKMKSFVNQSEQELIHKLKLNHLFANETNNPQINEQLDAKIFPNCFLPQNLFKSDEQHQQTNQLKSFKLGFIKLKSDTLSFLTSDNPLAYHLYNNKLESIWLALTPDLLFFGAKDMHLFSQICSFSPESICVAYNSFLFQCSNFLISNNSAFLRMYLCL